MTTSDGRSAPPWGEGLIPAASAPAPTFARGEPTVPPALSVVLLLMPSALLAVSTLITTGPARTWLVVGFAVEMIGALWWTYGAPLAHRSAFLPVGVFSLVAAIWFWQCPPDPARDWLVPLAHGLLLLGPTALFGMEFAIAAGLPELRRSRKVVGRILRRHRWPDNPAECRRLPDVRALRDATRGDPGPVWLLLNDARPVVRFAGLAALEFRPTWRPGQAEAVLKLFRSEESSPLRAAALRALGGVEDPYLLDLFRRMLHDPSREVRRAALEVILRKAGRHWGRFRESVLSALRDPRFAGDGPLVDAHSPPLPEPVAHDLLGWSGEAGPAAMRSTLTLIAHFRRLLDDRAAPELAGNLRRLLTDTKVPVIVRVELAHLLRSEGLLDPALYGDLLAPSQPGALRLLAAEAVLLDNPRHKEAVEVLRDLARQPNREMALGIAAIVQRCLQVDLGLPWGQPPPAPQSKQAAEVARKVMAWAAQGDAPPPAPPALLEEPFEVTPSPPPDDAKAPEADWEW